MIRPESADLGVGGLAKPAVGHLALRVNDPQQSSKRPERRSEHGGSGSQHVRPQDVGRRHQTLKHGHMEGDDERSSCGEVGAERGESRAPGGLAPVGIARVEGLGRQQCGAVIQQDGADGTAKVCCQGGQDSRDKEFVDFPCRNRAITLDIADRG